jgi:hypothetical protein
MAQLAAIHPFLGAILVINGMSAGLSAASYDQPTDRPYVGKYQNQPKRAVGPIREDGEA